MASNTTTPGSYAEERNYVEKILPCPILVENAAGDAAEIFSATSATAVIISRVQFYQTVAADHPTKDMVVSITDGTNELTTLTIPDNATVGTITDSGAIAVTGIAAGEDITFVLKTAGTGGGAAGSGILTVNYFEYNAG